MSYLAKVQQRRAYVKRVWAPDPVTVKMAIDAHASELIWESEKGTITVYPNPGSYEGAHEAPGPQRTDLACHAIAFFSYYRDWVKYTFLEQVYIWTGLKSAEQQDWDRDALVDIDNELRRWAN